MDVSEVRARIDGIDNQIADLFVERMNTVRELVTYKAALGMPVFDSAREREILARMAERVGPGLELDSKRLFETLMEVSRAQQRRMLGVDSPLAERIRSALARVAEFPTKAAVACQGAEGSYAQQACDAMFPFARIVYFQDFEGVFQAVEKGLCQYGVLPVENSWAGSVTQVYDLMTNRVFSIARAARRAIDHVLLAPRGAKLEEVRRVYSHPQALSQCSIFLKGHPAIEIVPEDNTAAAAKRVAQRGKPDEAAIASGVCASIYQLEPLAHDIANSQSNTTRFLCIQRELAITPDANRVSLILTLPHRPGALYAMMSRFAALGLNLTKLESRPIPGSDFQFRFHIDLEADVGDPKVISLMGDLERSAERVQFLGAYREI